MHVIRVGSSKDLNRLCWSVITDVINHGLMLSCHTGFDRDLYLLKSTTLTNPHNSAFLIVHDPSLPMIGRFQARESSIRSNSTRESIRCAKTSPRNIGKVNCSRIIMMPSQGPCNRGQISSMASYCHDHMATHAWVTCLVSWLMCPSPPCPHAWNIHAWPWSMTLAWPHLLSCAP